MSERTNSFGSNLSVGRVMAQAVSRRPLTAEARVCTQVSPCGVCGGQSGNGTGFYTSFSVFPCQHNFTVALHTHIIRGMNNWPVGGRSSETSSHLIT
jgi:hypothetical protein